MEIFLCFFFCLILLLVNLYVSSCRSRARFESKGIPFQGNRSLFDQVNSVAGVGNIDDSVANYAKLKAKGQFLVGSKDFGMANLTIMDPELIKSVLVKDFEHFLSRRKFISPKNDLVLGKMLFCIGGDKWRALRTTLSPTFTGSKIKQLFQLFNESGKKLVKFVEAEMSQNEEQGEFDIANGYSKFTIDVIASAVCGIDCKAFGQREPSQFEQMRTKLQTSFNISQLIKLAVLFTSETLSEFFQLSFFANDARHFFSDIIKTSIHRRQENKENKERPNDFLQLMLEARELFSKIENIKLMKIRETGKYSNNISTDILDDDGIVANAILFMLAGVETTQSLLLFCAYSLALNQDCQEKLRKEINGTLEENDGEFMYERLNKIAYLDMFINETLRMYPPGPATDRSCTLEYKVPDTEFVLKEGDGIIIPIYAIHHDPEYFPNPTNFDPERFSPENKGNIKPYTFMPFGQGPTVREIVLE